MPDPLVTASLISGGASLLGGFLGGGDSPGVGPYDRRPNKFEKEQFQFQKDQFEYQKELNATKSQLAVEDAKAAGLHPLFALGTSANYSPVSTSGSVIPGQPSQTGNAVGRGIAEAGRQVGNLIGQRPLIQSQISANDAAAERDYAQAAVNLSKVKTAEQVANFSQDQDIMMSAGMQKHGFNSRQHAINPNPPLYIKVYDNLKKRTINLVNPELNLEAPEAVGGYYWSQGKLHDPSHRVIDPRRLSKRTPQVKTENYDFSNFPIR